jgi:hypothetical protein
MLFFIIRNLEINNKCVIVSDICRKANFPILLENRIVSYMKESISRRKEIYGIKDLKLLLSELPSNIKYEVKSYN